MARYLTLVFVTLVVVAMLVFHLRNDAEVIVDYLVGNARLPLSAWLFLAFATGAVCGVLACVPMLLKQQVRATRLARRARHTAPAGTAPTRPDGGHPSP